MINKETNKSCIISCLEIDKIKTYDAQSIANDLGKYFSNIGKIYAEKTGKPSRSINEYNKKIPLSEKTLFLNPTCLQEVSKLIDSLKNKRSSGHDDISNWLLKKLKLVIMNPVSIIINKSLQEGHFPTRMKTAQVVPLYKCKERYLKNNYRPISLLLTISKLLEKVIYKRTYSFMENTNQIYEGQFGFRSKHSCENAVQNLLGDIVKNDSLNKTTVAVFFDLSKAFDTLSHPILFDKLEKYGICSNSLDWFKSYLTDQNITVKCSTPEIQKIFSDVYPVEFGAPQGSCLGPLLFSIFTNDISRHLRHTKCILFADDTTIYMSHKNTNYLNWCIEDDLKCLDDWFKANLLTLNLGKSVVMTYEPKEFSGSNMSAGCTRSFAGSNIKVNEVSLPNVSTTKFLGIWIDKKLAWTMHMSKLCIKLKQNLYLLRVGRNYLNLHARKCVYYAQFCSHVSYGITVWGNMITQTAQNKLQKLQNKWFKLVVKKLPHTTTIKIRYYELLK